MTKQKLKDMLRTDNVKQFNNMQLFVVNDIYLYSYRTLIGIYINDVWHITIYKYSVTTSKQITVFSRGRVIARIEEEELKKKYLELNNLL